MPYEDPVDYPKIIPFPYSMAVLMVDLFCTPFIDLIDRLRLEYRNRGSLFDLPAAKWFRPTAGGADLRVRFHDQIAGNPVGPASGPQTQMAQNLVLSWLAGSRIMELKTVQLNDQLKIPRPCIDAANVGYNVEWSQELLVHESLDQYVQGAMLIHMLRQAPEEFGHPFGEYPMGDPHGDPIYDMSIGYDLAGIQSAKVRGFLRSMIDATAVVEQHRDLIPRRLSRLRDLDYPTELSRSITLSTFHGCPADEIERICEFLLTDIGVHTIVKMNPPMLGKQRLEHLLYDVMGYHEVEVHQQAYDTGLQFDESIDVCRRLARLAASHGLGFGAKFSNTLEVINHRNFFPPDEKVMYLSGAPLHVITMTLMGEFREAVGPEMPISFSAGVDRKNFPDLVACGLVPVTTCTDLLKTGGYGRLPHYLTDLQTRMQQVGAGTIDDFILDCLGNRAAAGGNPLLAANLNTATIIEQTQADDRYHQSKNAKIPRRIDSHLTLFDCITCDKCIPVCPNDANFLYETEAVQVDYRDVEVLADGTVREVGPVRSFNVERREQIANFADYCNHCGNCDTFCPEYDGPYLMKPSFFGSLRAFQAGAPHDGFFVQRQQREGQAIVQVVARIAGKPYSLETGGAEDVFVDDQIAVAVKGGAIRWWPHGKRPASPHLVNIGRYHAMRTLVDGILNPSRIQPISLGFMEPERRSLV